MTDEPYVDRSVPIERIELGEGAWVDIARGWMTGAEANEAIPPAYTRYLGQQWATS